MCFKKFFAEKVSSVEIGNKILMLPYGKSYFVLFPEDLFYGDNESELKSLFDEKNVKMISGRGKGMVVFSNTLEACDFCFSLEEAFPLLKFEGKRKKSEACLFPEEQSFIFSNLPLEKESAARAFL